MTTFSSFHQSFSQLMAALALEQLSMRLSLFQFFQGVWEPVGQFLSLILFLQLHRSNKFGLLTLVLVKLTVWYFCISEAAIILP